MSSTCRNFPLCSNTNLIESDCTSCAKEICQSCYDRLEWVSCYDCLGYKWCSDCWDKGGFSVCENCKLAYCSDTCFGTDCERCFEQDLNLNLCTNCSAECIHQTSEDESSDMEDLGCDQ